MLDFSVPLVFTGEDFIDLQHRNERFGPQEDMDHIPNRFGFRPAIELLRTAVPAPDHPIGISGDDGIVGEVDELGLALEFIMLTG